MTDLKSLLKEIEDTDLQSRLKIVSGLLARRSWKLAEAILSRTYNELVFYNELGRVISKGGEKTFGKKIEVKKA